MMKSRKNQIIKSKFRKNKSKSRKTRKYKKIGGAYSRNNPPLGMVYRPDGVGNFVNRSTAPRGAYSQGQVLLNDPSMYERPPPNTETHQMLTAPQIEEERKWRRGQGPKPQHIIDNERRDQILREHRSGKTTLTQEIFNAERLQEQEEREGAARMKHAEEQFERYDRLARNRANKTRRMREDPERFITNSATTVAKFSGKEGTPEYNTAFANAKLKLKNEVNRELAK